MFFVDFGFGPSLEDFGSARLGSTGRLGSKPNGSHAGAQSVANNPPSVPSPQSRVCASRGASPQRASSRARARVTARHREPERINGSTNPLLESLFSLLQIAMFMPCVGSPCSWWFRLVGEPFTRKLISSLQIANSGPGLPKENGQESRNNKETMT